jgi:peptidyl-prolyl cis-trans isomerase C
MHRLIACTLCLLSLTFAACSQSSKVIAKVDGTSITAADLTAEMRLERGSYDPALLRTDANFEQFRKMAFDRLVQEAILLQEAKRLGVTASDEELAQIDDAGKEAQATFKQVLAEQGIDAKRWREAQRRRLLIGKLIDAEVMEKIPVDQAKVDAYYKEHPQEFRENTQFHARQILVDTREEAERIHARLKKGDDFAELARNFSVSPDGKRGGDLGFFDAQAYPEAFANVCQQLAIGQVSDVVATPYGYQIFQLLEKRPARQRPFEEVRMQIKKHLQEEKIEEVFEPWLKGLTEKAKLEIDDAALKEVKLEG